MRGCHYWYQERHTLGAPFRARALRGVFESEREDMTINEKLDEVEQAIDAGLIKSALRLIVLILREVVKEP